MRNSEIVDFEYALKQQSPFALRDTIQKQLRDTIGATGMDKLKPIFPARMRRIDPALEAEGTNTLFQAFAWRRKTHGKKFSLKGLSTGANDYNSRIHSPVLPRSLQSVYSPRGYLVQAATDIWLTPHSGRDIVEAIYLEIRREQRFIPVVFGAIYLILSAIYIKTNKHLGVFEILFLFNLTYFMWQLNNMTALTSMNSARKYAMERRFEFWNMPSGFINRVSYKLLAVLNYIGLMALSYFISSVIIGITILFVMAIDYVLSKPFPDLYNTYLSEHTGTLYSIIVLAFIGIILQLSHGFLRNLYVKQYQKSIIKANNAYLHFVTHHLFQDEEPKQAPHVENDSSK